MPSPTPELEHWLRQGFKRFNPFMVALFRLGLAPFVNAWPDVGGRILVIVHRGRKTGRRRLTPVNYAVVRGDLYLTAGFGSAADWYRNLQNDPNVEVWLPDGWWAGVTEDVSDSPERLPILRQVLIASGVVAPLVGVDPHALDDAHLAAATAAYRLVRLRCLEARTGPGGPGELAWVWPLAAMALFPLALRALWPRRR
jgi:deazaflavin-dependent oxidoreductase (nitroreductase family)